MDFTGQTLFDITEFLKSRETMKLRPTYCGLCGHKFKHGDVARWLYTNHLEGYGGNPMVCEPCDEGAESNLERWKTTVDEFKKLKRSKRFKTCNQLY